jgi:hypothetical protein
MLRMQWSGLTPFHFNERNREQEWVNFFNNRPRRQLRKHILPRIPSDRLQKADTIRSRKEKSTTETWRRPLIPGWKVT